MKSDSENSIGILDRRYILLEMLGDGSSSIVYKVKDSLSNKIYAAKVFIEYTEKMEEVIKKEIEHNKILSQNINGKFPNFIKYITSSVGPLELKNGSQGSNTPEIKAYIIFEFGTKGTLIDYITCKENIDEKFVKVIFLKIVEVVKYLHELDLCHRDLKMENIVLCGEEFIIKLIDFGFSSKIKRLENGRVKYQAGKVGSKGYQAPEVIRGIPYNGEKADIFSLGVILFFLRIGQRGFEEAKCYNYNSLRVKNQPYLILYNLIRDNRQEYWTILEKGYPQKIKELSKQFRKLYLRMVAFEPKDRPTLDEILNNDYFSDIRALTKDQKQLLEEELIKEFRIRESLIEKRKKAD